MVRSWSPTMNSSPISSSTGWRMRRNTPLPCSRSCSQTRPLTQRIWASRGWQNFSFSMAIAPSRADDRGVAERLVERGAAGEAALHDEPEARLLLLGGRLADQLRDRRAGGGGGLGLGRRAAAAAGSSATVSGASARVSFFVASFWISRRGGSSRRCMPPTARPAMTSSNLPSRSMIAISMCWPFMSWRT